MKHGETTASHEGDAAVHVAGDKGAINEPSSAPALPLELSRKLKKLTTVVAPPSTDDGEAVTVKVHSHHAAPEKSEATKARVAVESDPIEAAPKPSEESSEKQTFVAQETSEPEESESTPQQDLAEEDEYTDDKTNAAVDDIVRGEGDAILAAEDAKYGTAEPVAPPKHRHHFFKKWLGTSLGRWLTFIVVVAVAAGIFAVPTARYWVLNRFGVRASLSVTVTDAGTLLPLEGTTISMQGQSATTNNNGVATIHHLRLGAQTLTLAHVAYATQTHHVTVGWGENPLGGTYPMQPTGVRYVVKAVDYFSGEPIATASAIETDTSQVPADKNGLITLTLDTNGSATASATIGAGGYNSAVATLKPNTTNVVALVPSQHDVFIAKAAGVYNVYSVDADGSNQQLLLAGTGLETSSMALMTSPDNSEAALVSHRDNTTDSAGKAEQTLTLLNVGTAAATTLDHADQIKLLDWSGSTLVYELITNASGNQAAQYVIMSYDFAKAARQELASSADFNTVIAAQGAVFYAPSGSGDKATVGLIKVNDNGSGQQALVDQEVIGLYRSDYNTLLIQTASNWYTYSLDGSASPAEIAAPTNHQNSMYMLSPDGNNIAAITAVNGITTVQITNVFSGKVTASITAPAPSLPLHWLNDSTVVFRTAGSAPADYGVSISGGTPKKITSVFNAIGFSEAQ